MDYPDYIILRKGVPHLRDTKVTVSQVIALQQQGAAVSDILDAYPDLRESDLRTAVLYYEMHEAEIDAAIESAGLKQAS